MPGPFDVAIVGFDLDGTLLDSSADLASATNRVLALLDRERLTNEQILPFIGLGPRHMLEQALLATGGIPADQFDKLFHHLLSHYEENIAVETRLYPGALELIRILQCKGVKLGVVTNKLEYLARKLLSELSVLDAMHVVIGGDTLGPGNAKPSGIPVTEMIRLCGYGRAVFVGDSIHDIEAARNAGVPSVLLRHSRSVAELADFGADFVFADFEELTAGFEEAWGG